jgi:hypothetical protein
MSRVHKVATVQFEPTMCEKERNIARLIELCEAAALSGARLIVTPGDGHHRLLLVRPGGGRAVRRDDSGPEARGCRRIWRGEVWFRPARCYSTGSGRLGGAAAAGRTMERSPAVPSPI